MNRIAKLLVQLLVAAGVIYWVGLMGAAALNEAVRLNKLTAQQTTR